MRTLSILFLLSISCSVYAQSSLRQLIDCASYQHYQQHHISPNKQYDSAKLKQLTFQHWFVPPPPDFNASEQEPMMNTPHVAIKTTHGWLSGISHGEFGGAIVHHKSDGSIEIVAKAVVEDMYEMPFGIVVTEGLAHLSSNRGSILLINDTATGFEVNTIHGLPGMPTSSWKLPNGDLLINTHKRGSLVLNQHAQLQLVQCQ